MIPRAYHTLGALSVPGQTADCKPRPPYWVTTSFPKIDAVLGGLRRGSVTLLSGPFASGKTFTSVRIGAANTTRGINVLHISIGAHNDIDEWYASVPGFDSRRLRLLRIRSGVALRDLIRQIRGVSLGLELGLVIVDTLDLVDGWEYTGGHNAPLFTGALKKFALLLTITRKAGFPVSSLDHELGMGFEPTTPNSNQWFGYTLRIKRAHGAPCQRSIGVSVPKS